MVHVHVECLRVHTNQKKLPKIGLRYTSYRRYTWYRGIFSYMRPNKLLMHDVCGQRDRAVHTGQFPPKKRIVFASEFIK